MSENEKKTVETIKETMFDRDTSGSETDDFEEFEKVYRTIQIQNETMPVIPLRGISVYPAMMLHFDLGREKSVSALESAMLTDQQVFLVTQRDADTDLPTVDDFYDIGTTAHIKQMLRLPGNAIRVLVEGISRGRIVRMVHEIPHFRAEIEKIQEDESRVDEVKTAALMRTVLTQFAEYLDHSQKVSREIYPSIEAIEEPGRMADIIASNLDIKTEDKQAILDEIDVVARLELISEIISREIEIIKLENDISNKVKQKLTENQKEYYLREQMKTIQSELGQDETVEEEVEKWLERLKDLHLQEKTHDKIEKEIKRMLRLQPASPDASVLRNYIECVLELPWNDSTEDQTDLKRTRDILNEDHYGMEKVKERIVEYLAVRSLTEEFKGPIICLVGPPGVGKTSIARSIARSLDRKFVRMSLGGVHDEAEIRGHRRTYVGAIPGRIITSIRDVGVNNPLFLFDEIDKVGADYRGDPAAALLEVLDPEQNNDFKDHYLDVPFDLSKVLFITTANTTDTIPQPLLDRMELIQLTSYTEVEKVEIARRHLIPKQNKENGLQEGQAAFSESAIHDIINYYTREAGVRNLERQIGSCCRKVATKIVDAGASGRDKKYRITAGNLRSYLGNRKSSYDNVEPGSETGVTTGLAWTQVGGDTLFIETTVMEGSGKLMLTGQLGEVMQESAKIGLSVIRSRSEALGIPGEFFKEKDIHVHVPEGAIPKDGPSAGVTMCTSMVSAFTGTPCRRDLAMTGEISLRGIVLPIGGVKEKVLAAHRAGVKKVLLPERNMSDLDEIPESVRKVIEFQAVKTIDEVLEQALVRESREVTD